MALTYGTVTGRFEDTASGFVPYSGKVYFTAETDYLLTDDAFILPTTESVDLIDGAFSIELLATDNEELSAYNWTYRVEFALMEGSRPIRLEGFSIKVPSGEPQDLASLAPVASSNGVTITRGPVGPAGAASTVPGPQGIRGSRWYVSEPANVDYFNVVGPVEGDIFLYQASRDLFRYSGGEWAYAGSLGA